VVQLLSGTTTFNSSSAQQPFQVQGSLANLAVAAKANRFVQPFVKLSLFFLPTAVEKRRQPLIVPSKP